MGTHEDVTTGALDMALRALTEVQQGALVSAPRETSESGNDFFVVRGLATTIAVLVQTGAAEWQMVTVKDSEGNVVTYRNRVALTDLGIALRVRLEQTKPAEWLMDAHNREKEA